MNFLKITLLFCLTLAFSAQPGIQKDGNLDRALIRQQYMNSEFDKVLSTLEPYVKLKGENMSRDEKVFCYKHLAVIYAANPNGKTKAESYMYQMLKIVPSIELVDMYVNDNVEMMFDSVKKKFLSTQAYKQKFDELGNPIVQPTGETQSSTAVSPTVQTTNNQNSDRKEAKEIKTKSSTAWMWWVGGGVAVAGAITTYVLLSQENQENSTADVDPFKQ